MVDEGILTSITAAKSNRDTPNIVLAPSKEDPVKHVNLHVYPGTVGLIAGDCFLSKLGEYAGLVHGNVLGAVTGGILRAYKLYRGVMRPYGDSIIGRDMYIYVSNPDATYSYPPEAKFKEVCLAKNPKPLNSVFVAYAEFYDTEQIQNDRFLLEYNIAGVVKFWEWDFADKAESSLPKDSSGRFLENIW